MLLLYATNTRGVGPTVAVCDPEQFFSMNELVLVTLISKSWHDVSNHQLNLIFDFNGDIPLVLECHQLNLIFDFNGDIPTPMERFFRGGGNLAFAFPMFSSMSGRGSYMFILFHIHFSPFIFPIFYSLIV